MLLEELINREKLIRDTAAAFYEHPLPKLGKFADDAVDQGIKLANVTTSVLGVQF